MSTASLASAGGGQPVGDTLQVPDRLISDRLIPARSAEAVVLRVSGGRPLQLSAHLLAEASSWSAGAPAWHEIALYQSHDGVIAVALRLCTQPGGMGDLSQVRQFTSLADAAVWLCGINPTADLTTDLDASDRRLSGVEIALRAATLRQRADRIERQYKGMIGELLFCLENSDIAADRVSMAR